MQLGAVFDLVDGSSTADACFKALAERLSGDISLSCAAWISGRDGAPRATWPEGFALRPSTLERIRGMARTEILDVGRELPDEVEHPDADALVVPLAEAERETGSAVLFLARRGAFGERTEGFEQLAHAFDHAASVLDRAKRAEELCDGLRRRAEETEALHTLGLGINRSLDPDAVFPLVARLSRTLLAAQYAALYVREQEGHRLVAWAGVGRGGRPSDADPFLESVVERRHPVAVDLDAEPEDALQADRRAGAVTLIVAPLVLYGTPAGALVAGYLRRPVITDRDLRLAATLAGHAAVAVTNARLHSDLAERTADLERANDELNRLSVMKERFFASMNHELRTPLSAVMGFNALMLDGGTGPLPEKTMEYLRRSQQAASGLLSLVNDILDLSKISAGMMRVFPEPFLLDDLLREVVETVRLMAEEKGLDLELEIRGDAPRLETDAKRVRQILINLVANAIKFTREGRVRVEADCDVTDSDQVEIRVIDTGEGIDPDSLDRMFEEFEQEGTGDRGTGLGLPISRRLARLLGGDLWAESVPGTGSTFTLRIPRVLRPEPAVSPVDAG